MRLLALLLLLSALLALPLGARASSDKVSKETLVSRGKKRTFYAFVPGSLKAPTPVPLIILLHGSGRNGLSLVEKWKDLAAKEGFIIAGPDASDPQVWSTDEDGPDLLRDLVETLGKTYPVNPRRIYLFGHSAGAVYAINLSLVESEYFAAVAVHAGSWRDERDYSVMDFARRKTPLAIFVGDRDQFFPLSSVKATEAALKGRGFPVEVRIMKGHDHWYYNLAPEINRNAWEFLKQHELGTDPKFAEYNPAGDAGEANKLISELNELRLRANELLQRFYVKEEELKRKDFAREKEAVAAAAREQSTLLTEAANALRESALKAERLSKMGLKSFYPEYFSLFAQQGRKRAESAEAMREYAQLLLSDLPPDAVTLKRNEAVVKAETLRMEADELERKAERLKDQ